MSVEQRIELCRTAAVEEGQAIRVEAAGLTLAVFRVNGEFFVTDDHCTHGPGSLSEGFLDGYEIECDFHGGCFDIRSGEVTAPPCMEPVRTYRAEVSGDHVVVTL